MATRPADRHSADNPPALDLLQSLIEAPPRRASEQPRPPTQQHHARSTAAPEAGDLLAELLETTPARAAERRRPVALRSASEQARLALHGYTLRTWVDSALHNAERLLMLAAVLVFGYWFVDGPVRDWLHARQATNTPVVAAAPAPRATAVLARHPAVPPRNKDEDATHSALLPYTTPDMAADAPADEFMAPRRRPIEAPVAVAPEPTHLIMPSIGVDTPIKEVFIVDGAWEVADYAAGYLHGTGLPGDPGNTVLAGHAGLRGAVFRDLGALSPGDDVYMDAGGWHYHYRVRETKSVWPEQVEILDQTMSPVLTMLTCTNWDTQRLVVVADLVDSKPSPGP
jgi:sortase A